MPSAPKVEKPRSLYNVASLAYIGDCIYEILGLEECVDTIVGDEMVRYFWRTKKASHNRYKLYKHKTNCSRAQSPCENECKRVRAVRQWIESNPQQEETGRPVIEEQALETGCQVEQVCGGLGVSHTRVGVRRPIRGRQAFLDLLARFEMERAKEMHILLESQLVSNFSHRNRIQALFRGRFMRNQSFVQDEKPTSTATTELGLLRQTNTVSDLRKGHPSFRWRKKPKYEQSSDATTFC